MLHDVHLEYEGHRYIFEWDDLGYDQIEDGYFIWTDGNYCCDCNRSLFIKNHCDPTFPELTCGDKIKLVLIVKQGEDIYDAS